MEVYYWIISKLFKNKNSKWIFGPLKKRFEKHNIFFEIEESFDKDRFWLGANIVFFEVMENKKKFLDGSCDPRLADFGVLEPVKSLILEFYIDPLDEWIYYFQEVNSSNPTKINCFK